MQLAPEQVWSTLTHHPLILALDRLLARFFHCLRTTRCLLIIDQAEALGGHGVMKEAEQQTLMQLLRWVAESTHQNCLLVSSREQPQSLVRPARQTSAVRVLDWRGWSVK